MGQMPWSRLDSKRMNSTIKNVQEYENNKAKIEINRKRDEERQSAQFYRELKLKEYVEASITHQIDNLSAKGITDISHIVRILKSPNIIRSIVNRIKMTVSIVDNSKRQ